MSGDKLPIVEQLEAREAKHREVIANSQVVVDLLRPQMALFEAHEGKHNLYAVRMSVDHQSSIRTTTKEADELAQAAITITELVSALLMARSWVNEHGDSCAWLVPSESADGPPNKCDCGLPDRLAVIDTALSNTRGDKNEQE